MDSSSASGPDAAAPARPLEARRSGATALAAAILDHLRYHQAVPLAYATRQDWYMALALAVRDRMLDRYMETLHAVTAPQADRRIVAYLSAEFLTGPHLGNNLLCLGMQEAAREALSGLGQNLNDLLEQEEEPGLGNGGLGRLAACYMDSLATLSVPAIGYGIRYEFGIFDQAIRDGWQVEMTDKWLRFGNPWEIARPEISISVAFGGRTEHTRDEQGRLRVKWIPATLVKGVPYDTVVPGYLRASANVLRLWKAEAVESFDFDAFNLGDYYRAVSEKIWSETISKVLYPNDEPEAGKHLRLQQQFFFVSCSLQDMIRIHRVFRRPLDDFASYWAVQMNDTHPSIAVAELMRLLVDEHGLDWDRAWTITQETCAYTNHTLLSEALEKWPLPLFAALLPRHLEIIFEINQRFLDDVRRRCPGDDELIRRLSIIDDSGDKSVRMAHLASVGSHAINGVAALHTELLKETVLRDFHAVYPSRIVNVTNGVTPRRWIALSNPQLSALISDRIGDRWVWSLEEELIRLEPLAEDVEFRAAWQAVKADNKRRLAEIIRQRVGLEVDSRSLFDIQVKRLHEYKRQHLNVLFLVNEYLRLTSGGLPGPPRTVIFGGKAAPGYRMAKLIIRLIHGVAEVINADPDVSPVLKVVFVPDFNVTNGHPIYPAADLSEQISTAGKEASGTGNMKFAMNGALTIGTLDGANVEIRDAVGPENFFLFGLTARDVSARKAAGYRPRDVYESNPDLRATIDLIASGAFARGDRDLFRPLVDALLSRDDYMLFADFQSYVECQARVSEAYRHQQAWTRMSILNSARAGRFSSDRSIRDYCRDIWNVEPDTIGEG